MENSRVEYDLPALKFFAFASLSLFVFACVHRCSAVRVMYSVHLWFGAASALDFCAGFLNLISVLDSALDFCVGFLRWISALDSA